VNHELVAEKSHQYPFLATCQLAVPTTGRSYLSLQQKGTLICSGSSNYYCQALR